MWRVILVSFGQEPGRERRVRPEIPIPSDQLLSSSFSTLLDLHFSYQPDEPLTGELVEGLG